MKRELLPLGGLMLLCLTACAAPSLPPLPPPAPVLQASQRQACPRFVAPLPMTNLQLSQLAVDAVAWGEDCRRRHLATLQALGLTQEAAPNE